MRIIKEYLNSPRENLSRLPTRDPPGTHGKDHVKAEPFSLTVDDEELPEHVDLGNLPFRIREARPSDQAYILNTWGKTHYKHLKAKYYTSPRPDLFYSSYPHLIKQCLQRSRTVVATTEIDNEEFIIGFAVVEIPPPNKFNVKHVIHWLQVRRPMWRQHVATELLRTVDIVSLGQKDVVYTHHSPVMKFQFFRECDWYYFPLWLHPSLDSAEQLNIKTEEPREIPLDPLDRPIRG